MSTVKLFYYHSLSGNFGDDLNGWLWEELLPGRWSEQSKTLFSGIGTIIGNPMPPSEKVVIFTSGIGYSPVPRDFSSKRFDVVAVRGPLSAKVLGLKPDIAVADGALLLSALPRLKPLPASARSGVIFVPHHAALHDPGWKVASELAGIEFVDPRNDSKLVIQRLRSASLVIADSMHAAIIADTLRVPWLPVASSSHISSFKWLDWTQSLGIPYEPAHLPSPSLISSYSSWAHHFYNQAFQVVPPDVDTAINHLHATMAISRQRSWPKRQYHIKRLLYGVPNRLARVPGVSHLLARLDEKRISQTAKTLQALSTCSGYISDDHVLKARVDELQHRLAMVSTRY